MGTEYRVAKIKLSRVGLRFLELLWGEGAVEEHLTAMNYQGILAMAKLARDDNDLDLSTQIAAQEVVLENLSAELSNEYARYNGLKADATEKAGEAAPTPPESAPETTGA